MLSLRSSAVLCLVVKIYVITSHIRSKRTCSKCVLCIPYILCGSPNDWLHTCNAMCNNNLEIRIAGSSWRLWLSFIQIQTCQYILANSFWVKLINLFKCMRFLSFYGRSFWKRPRYFHIFPTIFRRLPNFAKKCVKLFWQPLSNSEVISSVKGKLNWIFVINHVLKNNYYVCQVWEIVLVSEWN